STPQPGTLTINVSSANLRSGPGTSYSTVGSATSGQQFEVIAQNGIASDRWYLIDRGNGSFAWVADQLVTLSQSPNQIAVAATIPPTAQSQVVQEGSGSNVSSSSSVPGAVNVGAIPFTTSGELTETGDMSTSNSEDLFIITVSKTQVSLSLTIVRDPWETGDICSGFASIYNIDSNWRSGSALGIIYLGGAENSSTISVTLPGSGQYLLSVSLGRAGTCGIPYTVGVQ
ncbi:MAG: SH3 domain-containing protein, partial [Anaerolineae bacterium]|nr:SH3 domain-containing protein [Anaerolineae bacterium]